jgi:hypothetical protein
MSRLPSGLAGFDSNEVHFMIKFIIAAIGLVWVISVPVYAQEVTVENFPLGVGTSVSSSFFQPYYPQLQTLADTLRKHPLARAVVTGGADGIRYRQNNDANNPGLAAGRAHALRNLLVDKFGVDSTQVIIQSGDVRGKGGRYRYASVRIAWELVHLKARLDTLAERPPVEKTVTQVQQVTQNLIESMGLQLGAGISSSPFEGIPFITGAVTWKRVFFIEGFVGYTFWRSQFNFRGTNLDTRRRLAGGQLVVYPLANVPIGVVAGWIRIEEISQKFYQYVKMSEGPTLGLRVEPIRFVNITGVYNPSKHSLAGEEKSRLKNRQFLFSASVNAVFGGGK